MPKQNDKYLRVFCLCGQKMKVIPEMYGRAAKCAACHQKWFIPERDEIAANVRVLKLKEHPELLRQTGQFVRQKNKKPDFAGIPPSQSNHSSRNICSSSNSQPTPPPMTGVELNENNESYGDQSSVTDDNLVSQDSKGNTGNTGNTGNAPPEYSDAALFVKKIIQTPVDDLAPLKALCSYDAEIVHRTKLAAMQSQSGDSEDILDAYARAIQRVRKKLNARMAEEQRSVQTQLHAIEEEIARLNVALRVGDCPLGSFLTLLRDLRRRRETLERHNHNLQAWQHVTDPYLAGGIVQVCLEDFDEEIFQTELPPPVSMDSEKPLFVAYGEELREALEIRGINEKRKAEWAKIAAEHSFSESAIEEGAAETRAALERCRARIRFLHERLERLSLDCANDLKTLHTYRQDILLRSEKGELRQGITPELLEQIQCAETDLIRTRNLMHKTLGANSPVEIPKASETLIGRLQQNPVRSFTYWPILFVLLGCLFLLMGLFFSYSESAIHHWLAAIVITVIAFGSCWFIPQHKIRMALAFGIWIMLLLLFAVYYYNIQTYSTVLLVKSIGGFITLIGLFSSGIGMGVSLSYLMKKRSAAITFLLAGGCACAGTGMVGIIPDVAAFSHKAAPDHRVEWSNHLSPPASFGSVNPRLPVQSESAEEISVQNEFFAEAGFIHDAQKEEMEEPYEGEREGEKEEGGNLLQTATNNLYTFALQGVLHGEGLSPRFRASLTYPDGTLKSLAMQLGDEVIGLWTIKEYNSSAKKLTISNGERLLVLEPGSQVEITVTMPFNSEGEETP